MREISLSFICREKYSTILRDQGRFQYLLLQILNPARAQTVQIQKKKPVPLKQLSFQKLFQILKNLLKNVQQIDWKILKIYWTMLTWLPRPIVAVIFVSISLHI